MPGHPAVMANGVSARQWLWVASASPQKWAWVASSSPQQWALVASASHQRWAWVRSASPQHRIGRPSASPQCTGCVQGPAVWTRAATQRRHKGIAQKRIQEGGMAGRQTAARCVLPRWGQGACEAKSQELPP